MPRPLTVLNVAYALATVGPGAVGGAEQVLSLIDEALVREGHRSLVVAMSGSRVHGTLCPTPATPLDEPLDAPVRERFVQHHRAAIARAMDLHPVDVVHLHGIDFAEYLPPAGVPVLATLHLPPAWYPVAALDPARPRTFLHCVSAAQHRACPRWMRLLPVIPNGVPFAPAGPPVRRRGFAIALGRICPEKGFHLALDAARLAGVPIVLAGRVFGYEAHRSYFAREIAPRLGRAARFVGPAAPRARQRLLADARCLLAPSLVPETSSLVAMEALASGTPVIAFATGALAEIVEHGVTGFLVRDEREMAAAIAETGSIDPEACRRSARERFSAGRMTRQYLQRYAVLAAGAFRHATAAPPPAGQTRNAATTRLPAGSASARNGSKALADALRR